MAASSITFAIVVSCQPTLTFTPWTPRIPSALTMDFPEAPEPAQPSKGRGNLQVPSEEEIRHLGERFARRETGAFAEVFRLFREPVYVIGILELGDPEEAEDLVQEAFRRAWVSAATLAEPGRLRPWLFAIARNLCVDFAKRSSRRPLPVKEIPEWRLQVDGREAPMSRAIRREKAQKVQRLLNSIPDRFRVVLAMRLIQERSYREISAATDLPLHGVKNAIARGGRILIEKLKNTPDLDSEGDL